MSGEESEIRAKSPQEVRLGDSVFSLQSNELRDPSGKVVHLRRQSTDVLAFLALRQGQTVSKADLIERVWPNTYVTDDSLGQCIVDIRRALKDSEHRIVRTYPKKGYMLAAQPSVEAKPLKAPVGDRGLGETKAGALDLKRTVYGVALLLAVTVLAAFWGVRGFLFETHPATELSVEPSIIVLPFSNQSDDDELDYLAAGFSTSIRTALARFPQLFVLAGSTALTFKDSPGTARGIGRELGVRYVLDGSLRKIDDVLLINAELIEAETERSIWARQFDFTTDDLLRVQADLVQQITGTLHFVIGEEELAAARLRPTENARAYDLFLRAEAATQLMTAAGRTEALDLLTQALDLDPNYLAVHFELSGRYLSLWRNGGAEAPEEALRLARYHADRALSISQTDYRGQFRLGMLHLFADHDHDLAHAAFLRALADNPNDADVLYNMGFLRSLMGEASEAIEWNDKAKRINPRYPGWYNFNAALSHYLKRDFDGALMLAKAGIAAYPKSLAPRRILVATLAEMGRMDEALEEANKIRAIDPDFRLSTFRNTPFQNRADQERYFGAMRLGGIPD